MVKSVQKMMIGPLGRVALLQMMVVPRKITKMGFLPQCATLLQKQNYLPGAAKEEHIKKGMHLTAAQALRCL